MKVMSRWGKNVNLKSPLQEYPRMQLQRGSYTNLNGYWEYQITDTDQVPQANLWKPINVPFPLGSQLSGSDEILLPGKVLWYKKQFSYKPGEYHTHLNFEAVDQQCIVYLNGIEVGRHIGGYEPFSLDVSSYIKYQNALLVKCTDPSDTGEYAYGKQKIQHGGMWYTPMSGIWQTVWLEDIPLHGVHALKITPNYDRQTVYLEMEGDFNHATITISAAGKMIYHEMTAEMRNEIYLEDMHPWTLEDPFLYDLYIETEDDIVKSYFGMRCFTCEKDEKGYPRFCLNHEPVFLSGVLDQGYTPEGNLTYPDDEMMIYDIQKVKELGFNMIRKHVKVESRRWYYHADRLGMLVMQDMPNGGQPSKLTTLYLPHLNITRMNDQNQKHLGRGDEWGKKAYYNELNAMIHNLYNVVSIFAWVPFNEGWGQFDSAKVTKHIQLMDLTRFVDSASGWHDQGAGDFYSRHVYFHTYTNPQNHEKRMSILSEFGGYSYLIPGHSLAQKLYGYKKFTDKLNLNTAIRKLYEDSIIRNIPKGLTACVFTQLTDVEDECNGIMTADREIVKLDEKRIRNLNQRCMRRLKK